jgi:hypothetical protein
MSDLLAWFLSTDLERDKLALLVLCAASIHILGANLSWRLQLDHTWWGRALVQILRLAYFVGIPGAVLWRGALVSQMGIPTTYAGGTDIPFSLHLLGLTKPEDMLTIGSGLVWGSGALVLAIATWIWYARAVPAARLPMPWWAVLREALLMQLHWAFYRSFAGLLLADPVRAAFAGLSLIALCWTLDPRRRHELFTPRGYLVAQDWMCALFTVIISLQVNALWLTIALHALWLWVGGRVLARFSIPDTAHSSQTILSPDST